MYCFKSIVLIAAAFAIGAECSGVPAAAPLIAPAQIGYAHAVPQNIPPYASQVNVFSRALSPLVAGPFAAPLAAPLPGPFAAPVAAPLSAPLVAPYAAPVPGPFAPAPYLAGPAPAPYALPAAYAAAPAAYAAAPAYASPFSYSASLLRSPYGYAPAYVR